jgi:hypothetical protein
VHGDGFQGVRKNISADQFESGLGAVRLDFPDLFRDVAVVNDRMVDTVFPENVDAARTAGGTPTGSVRRPPP